MRRRSRCMILKDNGYANMVAGQFVCVSMISCSRCSRDSAAYTYPNEFNSHIWRQRARRMDKRPLLAQSASRSCNPVPTHGLGCERCRVRVNEQFGRSRLAHPRSNKIFSIHQANNSSVRVRRSIRCASEATAEHTAPHRPPVGLGCGVKKKSNE